MKEIKTFLAKLLKKPISWLNSKITKQLYPDFGNIEDIVIEKLLEDKDFQKWADKWLKVIKK